VRSKYGDIGSSAGDVPVVLVTLYTPGQIIRAATRPIDIPDPDGDGPYLYDARLTSIDDFDREVDVFAIERGMITSARVGMVFPESLEPLSMEAAYYHLAASRCEVALIWEGQSWGQRDVIMGRGTISGLSMGVASQPVSFVVEALPPATGAPIGDAERDMKGTGLFPVIGTFGKLQGRQFPTIIGRCYRLPGFKIGPVFMLSNYGLLLAGHHMPATLPTVYEGEEAPTAYVSVGTMTMTNTSDYAGDPIAVIDGDVAAGVYDFAASPTQGAFTFDAEYGGVQAADGSNVPALGATGVISYILATSCEQVDFDKMRKTYALLGGIEIGVYVDKATDALKILRDRILSVLPLIEEQGEHGMWLRYVDIATMPVEVELIEGVNLVGRTGGMEQVSDPDELYNSFTVNYAYDHAIGRFGSSLTINGDNHPLCALSRQLYGERVAPAMNVDITWSAATASFIANSRANRLALPRYVTTWIADPSMYWLREGAIVSVTSETFGWTARKAVVRRVRATGNPIELMIEPIPGLLTAGVI